MRKSLLFAVILAISLSTLSACSKQPAPETDVAQNTARYQQLKSVATGVKMTDDEINTIIRTMLADGTTALDLVAAAGCTIEQSTPGDARLTCFLMEDADVFTLYFDSGLESYAASGKIVVESERRAAQKLFRDLVANFQYDAAAYMPPDSLRMVCYNDDGSPSYDHTYYYDHAQYVAALDELFQLVGN